MAPPIRDTGPVTHRLGHDNRTIYAADSNNPYLVYQVVLSNREVKIPGKILVFRRLGESDADAIARHIKEAGRTPDMAIDYNHGAVDLVGASVVVNTPRNIGHTGANVRSNSQMDHALATHYNSPAVSNNSVMVLLSVLISFASTADQAAKSSPVPIANTAPIAPTVSRASIKSGEATATSTNTNTNTTKRCEALSIRTTTKPIVLRPSTDTI